MSSPALFAPAHLMYKKVTAKNAKCDICNTRNLGVMQKCVICGVTTCEHCKAAGRYDGKHNLTNLSLDWTKPSPNRKGVQASVRNEEAAVLIDSSDDDTGLYVSQTPRATRAPGTSRREGLIREPATMTAACNLRRAREDLANQRRDGVGYGSGSRYNAQFKGQGSSFAHDLHPKPGPGVVGDNDDDNLMEIPAPSSPGQFTGTIPEAETNITQHLQDENEILAAEVRRLKDKESSRFEEEHRLREELKKQTSLANEARVAYQREVGSHKQTIDELSDFRKNYDGCKDFLTKLSSEAIHNHGKTVLAPSSFTATWENPQPVLSLTMSSALSTGAAGSTTRAGAGSIRFGDLPAVKEARSNQISAGMFFKDDVTAPPPAWIPRDFFQAKRRKRKHTSPDTDILEPEDKDTSVEDVSNDDTISWASADVAKETPNVGKGQDRADTTKAMPPVATSQAGGSATKSTGTQTRLSAATYVGATTPIGRDLGAAVPQAVFGRTRAALLKIPSAAGPGRRGGDGVDDQVLFGVRRKWERSESFHKVKLAEGPLAALQILETAATLGCLAEGIAFPGRVDAYIQGIRKAILLRTQGGETGAVANRDGNGGFGNGTGSGSSIGGSE